MSFLPLEELEIIEIYFFYDKPLLFSCKDKSGNVFIALNVDECDSEEVWFYVPLSLSRFESLTNEEIQLRNVFTDAEDGFIYKVRVSHPEGISKIEMINCSNISKEELPDP